jgi:hypothetical protein
MKTKYKTQSSYHDVKTTGRFNLEH